MTSINNTTRLSQLLLDTWRLAHDASPRGIENRLLDLLSTYMAFDAAMWGYAHVPPDEQTLRPHKVVLRDIPAAAIEAYDSLQEEDHVAQEVMRRPGRACLHDGDDPRLAFGTAMRAFDRRYGIHHVCSIATLHEFSGLAVFLSLYRRQGRPPFAAHEAELIEAALPHLVAAVETHQRHALLFTADHPVFESGSALADAFGVLHLADPNFLRLLRQEWPRWRGPTLPPVLSDPGRDALRLSQVVFSRRHLAEEGLWLVTVRPLNASDLLTPRQLEIARAYAEGKPHKVIAVDLGLAPATVRNHMRTVYTVLRVGNKQQLAHAIQAAPTANPPLMRA